MDGCDVGAESEEMSVVDDPLAVFSAWRFVLICFVSFVSLSITKMAPTVACRMRTRIVVRFYC